MATCTSKIIYLHLRILWSLNPQPVYSHLYRLITSILVLLVALASCDETPGVNALDNAPPRIADLELTPSDLQFDRIRDGVKDTTILFNISVRNIDVGPLDNPPILILNDLDLGVKRFDQELTTYNATTNRYSTTFTLSTNTNLFRNFELIVYAVNSEEELGNRIVRILKFSGIPGIKPLVANATITPAIAQIPLAGQAARRIDFVADVSDADGVDNIDQVFMRLVSETTGPLGTPFLMTAGSVTGNLKRYTTTLEINSSNSPDKIRVLFYADDRAGLRSDTLFRNLEIIR